MIIINMNLCGIQCMLKVEHSEINDKLAISSCEWKSVSYGGICVFPRMQEEEKCNDNHVFIVMKES